MKMPGMRRVIAAVSVTAAAGVLPLLAATPASAHRFDCYQYVMDAGYKVGPKVMAACDNRSFQGLPSTACLSGLSKLKIQWVVYFEACKRS